MPTVDQLVAEWLTTVAESPQELLYIGDALLAECPARAANYLQEKLPQTDVNHRLIRRVRKRFSDRMRKKAEKALGGGFTPSDGVVAGYQTGLLGTYRKRALVLLLTPAGVAVEDFAAEWSLRWELATIAAATGASSMFVIVSGTATQRRTEQFDCKVVASDAAVALLTDDPPRIQNSTCSTCVYAPLCPAEDRLPVGSQPLGEPPGITVKEAKAVKPQGTALFVRHFRPVEKLTRFLRDNDRTQTPGYHPSTIGRELEDDYPCMRVLYYQAKGVAQDDAWLWLLWVFEMGHSWHDVLQDVAKLRHADICVEKRIRRGRLVGHLDLRHEGTIIDIKSMSAAGGGTKGYTGQVESYAYAEALEENPPKQLAIVSCIKSTGELAVRTFPVDPAMQDKIAVVLGVADSYVDADHLPERFSDEADKQHSKCKACYYKGTCYNARGGVP